ncbi:MAG: GspH/FimT family pseudopilin [Gammaproteobacteria bacterium]|jgi:type IV fimbrial biogenesis protein FimT|nr:GspH/FimT family pseudopilin [Gammaproteobacteria bacterium]
MSHRAHVEVRSPPVPTRARQRGLTLVELMITIFIMAVLAMLAVPSFRDASLGSRLSAAANSLHGSIQIARSEAIKVNAPITLCASSDGSTCATGGDWDQGWIVMTADNVVLHSEPSLRNSYRVIEATGKLSLTFQPIGIGATDAVFTVCREDPVGNQERQVSVTATGIAYVTTTENGVCPPT